VAATVAGLSFGIIAQSAAARPLDPVRPICPRSARGAVDAGEPLGAGLADRTGSPGRRRRPATYVVAGDVEDDVDIARQL
jgi:hypothetical protein